MKNRYPEKPALRLASDLRFLPSLGGIAMDAQRSKQRRDVSRAAKLAVVFERLAALSQSRSFAQRRDRGWTRGAPAPNSPKLPATTEKKRPNTGLIIVNLFFLDAREPNPSTRSSSRWNIIADWVQCLVRYVLQGLRDQIMIGPQNCFLPSSAPLSSSSRNKPLQSVKSCLEGLLPCWLRP